MDEKDYLTLNFCIFFGKVGDYLRVNSEVFCINVYTKGKNVESLFMINLT